MDGINRRDERVFEVLLKASNVYLVKGTYKGEQVSIVSLMTEEKGTKCVHPMAVILNESNLSDVFLDEDNFEQI